VRIFSGSRILAVAGVLVTAPLATMAFGGPASAVSFPGATVTCTKLVGTTQLATANLTHCTAGATGGSGSVANFTLHSGDVAWANGTTTSYSGTATQGGKTCPPTAKEYKVSATVTSSTNASIPTGAAVKMKVCFDSQNLEARNVKNTVVSF
jgi:hypothetical protein